MISHDAGPSLAANSAFQYLAVCRKKGGSWRLPPSGTTCGWWSIV